MDFLEQLWFDVISKGYSTKGIWISGVVQLWFDVISKGYSTSTY